MNRLTYQDDYLDRQRTGEEQSQRQNFRVFAVRIVTPRLNNGLANTWWLAHPGNYHAAALCVGLILAAKPYIDPLRQAPPHVSIWCLLLRSCTCKPAWHIGTLVWINRQRGYCHFESYPVGLQTSAPPPSKAMDSIRNATCFA